MVHDLAAALSSIETDGASPSYIFQYLMRKHLGHSLNAGNFPGTNSRADGHLNVGDYCYLIL